MTETCQTLISARQRLDQAGVPDAARDALILLREAGGDPDGPLSPDTLARFDDLIGRRAAREPVARLLGRRAFWKHVFTVTPDVLDPRPDTEALVEQGLRVMQSTPAPRVLDLGTGSGCVLLSILGERGDATGLGTDLSDPALAVARQNATAVGLAERAHFLRADWLAGVRGPFDLIVSNPPYIAEDEMADLAPEVRDHDPLLALTPGGDGLSAYRRIASDAASVLAPGGWIALEIGYRQAAAVTAMLIEAGFTSVHVSQDLNRHDRVVSGQKPTI